MHIFILHHFRNENKRAREQEIECLCVNCVCTKVRVISLLAVSISISAYLRTDTIMDCDEVLVRCCALCVVLRSE